MTDLFSKGEIIRYFPEQRYGFIRDCAGHPVFFGLDEMDIVGNLKASTIREGMVVGYDLSRTSRGLRVKRMKLY